MAVAGPVVAVLVVAAVVVGGVPLRGGGHSHGSKTSQGPRSTTLPGQIYADNSGGAPERGGTLTMLGVGDVDYMDPNVSYLTIGYLNLRMWSRQLYNYPAVEGETTSVVPDLAAAMPNITNGGLDYSVTIRKGADWDTDPHRQVTAADVVRGVQRSCNPTEPYAGDSDFSDILAGYSTFCAGFSNMSSTNAADQAAFIDSHPISGVRVDRSDPSGLTVDFTLVKPATYFTDLLTLPPFAPVPSEILKYLPASSQLAQHTISDGPYRIESYRPGRSIVYVRNPAWNPDTDPLRNANVDRIVVNETGSANQIYRQVLANTPNADMEWDAGVPANVVPELISSKNPDFFMQSEFTNDPFIVFNTVSPTDRGALQKVAVRQAITYALDRASLIDEIGGRQVSPPLTHILPNGISGSSPDFNLYPYSPKMAKQLLVRAGITHMDLKLLYQPSYGASAAMFRTVQSELREVSRAWPSRSRSSTPSTSRSRARLEPLRGTCHWGLGVPTGMATRPNPSSCHCSTGTPCRRRRATTACSRTRPSTRSSTGLSPPPRLLKPPSCGTRPTWR